jgi:alpha-galactosidase
MHEALDARTFAEWGFDFLKYDWCSYGGVAGGKDREHFIRPYKLMWDELQKLDRDIVFNLCQYGMGKVWEWGGQVGHCWRTTGDLGIEGGRLSRGIYKVGLFNAELADYGAPGHWNDPDYILIGWVGAAHGMGEGRPTTLTPNEQYTHMSMWSLMAAPLIYSGDMTKLDPFTLNILCNHEIIDVDQDPLGKQGRIVRKTREVLILAKDLEDGSKAVGLFNLARSPARIEVDWKALNLTGPQRVRDLWRQKDLGMFSDAFKADVPRHGVTMVRVWPQK